MSDGAQALAMASRRSSVLVATSDSATRNLLRHLLNVGAVDLVDAVDGLEALALARRLDLDLIVIDAFLAVMDGIAVCGRIRTLSDIEQPPILMVGLISERAVELALSVGADETLAKPLNPTLIRSRTRALLTRRREEKRLRLTQRAMDAAPVGMTLLDARSSEYSVIHANRAFLDLTGHSPEEILGRNLRMLTGPETDLTTMTGLRDDLAAGRSSRVLLKNYRKDGEAFWNELAMAPVLDEAGRLTHFVAIQHDVTKHVEASRDGAAQAIEETVHERTGELEASLVRLEKQRRFAETILNSMVSAILATDSNGTVTFANLSALRTLGASVADCVGRSVVEIFGHNEGVAEIVEGAVPAHAEHRLDFPLTTPGGARIYVGISIVHAPPEFREEVKLIFLFRNLAETVLDDGDPRLTGLDDSRTRTDRADDEASPSVPERDPPDYLSTTPPRAAFEALTSREGASPSADPEGVRRRVLLSLHYTQPARLLRAAIEELVGERGTDQPPVELDAAEDLPEVLLDRQQARQALRLLIRGALDRCEDPGRVRVRVSRTEAPEERAGRQDPAVRIEILYRRELITDQELNVEGKGAVRPAYRRADLAEAEKLIEANGGRLHRPRRDAEEQTLTVLFPAAG